ncbi:unnamed protein product, partial [Urochloa humidicola]
FFLSSHRASLSSPSTTTPLSPSLACLDKSLSSFLAPFCPRRVCSGGCGERAAVAGMRAGGMLCRSQAATAVCVPGDARSMVVARRADRTIVAGAGVSDAASAARDLRDVRYARLGGSGESRRRSTSSRRFAAPRAGTAAAAPPPPPPPPPPPRPAAALSSGASCKPRVEIKRRGGTGAAADRAPVAVTLPMVTKSPAKEAPAKDLAAAAKLVSSAAALAAPGDQVLQKVAVKRFLLTHWYGATCVCARARRWW